MVLGFLKSPLVVILDDFEKLKYQSSTVTRDYFPFLSRFISVLEESLNHREVSFVVSLDNSVDSHVDKHRKEGGAFAFAHNKLCRLGNLKMEYLLDFVRVRLKAYGWKGKVAEFMTLDAFLGLVLSSASHPRRAVRILAESLKVVAERKGRRKKQVDLDAIRTGSMHALSPLNEKNWIVMDYLRKQGETSASDDGLRKALGYKKASRADGYHTSVDRQLRQVA